MADGGGGSAINRAQLEQRAADHSLALAEKEAEISSLQRQLTAKTQQLDELLAKSNSKIDNANRSISALQSEKDDLQKALDVLEVEKNTDKMRAEAETRRLESELTTSRAQAADANAKNLELLNIVSSLYDSTEGSALDRTSLDAYTARWS